MEKAQQEKESHGEIETEHPGYLGSQDSFFVGTMLVPAWVAPVAAVKNVLDRAGLASELALARWLLHGVRTDSGAIVDDAVGMLADLVTLIESQD